jgi:hypothetical protein
MSNELTVTPRVDVVRAEDFMPLMSVEQAVQRKQMMNDFIGKVMHEGEDYGAMPGDTRKGAKKVLLKPGAEKLCSIFGLAPRFIKETVIEDWTGAQHGGEPLFYYEYRCQLWKGERCMGEGIGSCNTWEAKYRYRWVREEDVPEKLIDTDLPMRGNKRTIREPWFALDKRETAGKYGKPMEYWNMFDKAQQQNTGRKVQWTSSSGKDMSGYEITVDETLYRVPNDNPAELVNTCQKIGQKRALIAATLVVTNCSDAFTQDLEDTAEEPRLDSSGEFNQDQPSEQRNTPAQQKELAEKRIAEEKAKPNDTPAALKPFFAKIDTDERNFVAACDHFYKLLSDRGAEGAKAYDKISRRFTERFPKGTPDKRILKSFIGELYDALQMLSEPQAQTPSTKTVEPDDLFQSDLPHDTVAYDHKAAVKS